MANVATVGTSGDCDNSLVGGYGFSCFSIALVTSVESGVMAGSKRCTTFPSAIDKKLGEVPLDIAGDSPFPFPWSGRHTGRLIRPFH